MEFYSTSQPSKPPSWCKSLGFSHFRLELLMSLRSRCRGSLGPKRLMARSLTCGRWGRLTATDRGHLLEALCVSSQILKVVWLRGTIVNEIDLSCLGFDPTALFLLSVLGEGSCDFLRVGILILEVRKHRPSLPCIKEREVGLELREKEHIRETRNTLRLFLKNKEAGGREEKIVFKIRQLRELAEREGLWLVVLPNVVLEVSHGRPFFESWFTKRAPNQLAIFLIGNIGPTGRSVHKEKVVLLIL
ncbi:hypothetical protein Cgig2_030422 [Carnegiea gigantea]|uniref:Uncharacterized protein n=1 Tax=Carnegiea gigantea TaxID=171969 RepID=A0A9Q1KME6_9CARY|nr:hypothetical protein Cgig2_030422 [Carnegiea gigantea]